MHVLTCMRVRLGRAAYGGSSRDRSQQPERVVDALGLRPGARIAELGPGGGYFTFRLAEAIGGDGVLYAVDTDRPMLDDLVERARARGLDQIRPVTPERSEASLPEPVELVFLSHVYHHLPQPAAYFRRLASDLSAGGRVAMVESTPVGWIRRLFGHATDPARIRADMTAAGYTLVEHHDFLLPRQTFLVFARPVETAAAA